MLECVAVVLDVVVVVVGVGKEILVLCKDICGAEVGTGESCLLWLAYLEDFTGVICQVLTQFVAKIGIDVLVAYDLYRIVAAYTAVVGGYNDGAVCLGKTAEESGYGRMAEPALGNAAVGCLVAGQFAHHAAFGACMAEHVDEIKHKDVEVVLQYVGQLLQQAVGGC